MHFSSHSPFGRGNFELLCSELEHGCEGGVVRDLQHLEGQLGVGCERDLEGDLRSRSRHSGSCLSENTELANLFVDWREAFPSLDYMSGQFN